MIESIVKGGARKRNANVRMLNQLSDKVSALEKRIEELEKKKPAPPKKKKTGGKNAKKT